MTSLPPPAPESAPTPDYCATCRAETQTKRYCAPGRCYCGHEACPAFDSWFDVRATPFRETKADKKRAAQKSSWDNREGATWIDSM